MLRSPVWLSLPETQIWLTASCESVDNRSNERSLPIDLVRDGRTRPVARSIAGRNPNPSTSAQCPKGANRRSEWPSAPSIGCCLSGSIASPPRCSTHSKSSSPRRSCVGIARVSGRIGAGNHDRAAAGQRRQWTFASSFTRLALPTRCGERHGFTASCSSLASMSARRP